jgi:hypothetical protein
MKERTVPGISLPPENNIRVEAELLKLLGQFDFASVNSLRVYIYPVLAKFLRK